MNGVCFGFTFSFYLDFNSMSCNSTNTSSYGNSFLIDWILAAILLLFALINLICVLCTKPKDNKSEEKYNALEMKTINDIPVHLKTFEFGGAPEE
jgi:uncharacterized protein YcgI (DUF1989 family)